MSKAKFTFDCPICKDRTPVKFTMPSYVGQSFCSVTCDNCESNFGVTIKRKRGAGPNQIEWGAAIEMIGEPAKAILAEREAVIRAKQAEFEKRALEVPK